MVAFAAAVLTGGASTRMGRDKALVEVGGRALARHVADTAAEAGASSVVCVGGDEGALAALGLTVIADHYPGQGPLGAVLTAFEVVDTSLLAVLACDLPDLDAATVRAVVDGVDDYGAAIAASGQDRHPLVGAYAIARCAGPFAAVFAAGGRAMFAALAAVRFRIVEVAEPRVVRNVNRPADLR